MTKGELKSRIVEGEQMLEAILPLSDGQECLIYKATEFSVSDEIIYIPDVWLNNLDVLHGSDDDDGISYAQRVVENCYTGRDFVDVCGGDVELAERLFHYCDWQHPSSALPELEDIDADEITFMVKAHQKLSSPRCEEHAQEQTKKPSIKDQLAVKPVPGDRPTKPKDREVR